MKKSCWQFKKFAKIKNFLGKALLFLKGKLLLYHINNLSYMDTKSFRSYIAHGKNYSVNNSLRYLD